MFNVPTRMFMKATLCKGGSRPPVLISMALPLNQVNFNPDAKNKSFSTATQNQVTDSHNEIKSIPTTHTTPKSVSSLH